MKVLLSSDYHINEDKRFEDTATVLEYIYQKTAEINPDYFVCLGDVFDKRRPTPKEMKMLDNWLLRLRHHVKDSIILLEGNHDQDNAVSGLDYLRDLDVAKIKVVAPPVRYFFEKDKPGFYFGHEQIDGAVSDGGVKLSGGSDLNKIMERYKFDCEIFAFGHFHKPQILKENPLAFYCGSINNGTFGEMHDKKLLWLFENNELVCNYVIPTRRMLHIVVQVQKDTPYNYIPFSQEPKDSLEGTMLKIEYVGTREALAQIKKDVERIKDIALNECKVHSLKVQYVITDKTKPRNDKVTETVSEELALKEYFKSSPERDELICEGMEIVRKVNGNG